MPAHPSEDETRYFAVAVAAPPDRAPIGNEFIDIAPLGRIVRLGARHHVSVRRVVGRFGSPVLSKAAQLGYRANTNIICLFRIVAYFCVFPQG